MAATTKQIPLVDCLVLDADGPHLVGHRCASCGATYLQRRNACGACGGLQLSLARLPDRGRIESFTVVHRGAPRRTGPFVSLVVRLDDGTYVKANLVDSPPDPDAVDCSRGVVLRTFVAGVDVDGTEAVGFGFVYDGSDE